MYAYQWWRGCLVFYFTVKVVLINMLYRKQQSIYRSSNPYIESTVEPCVSKNQKGIFAVWGVSLEENTEKALRQLKKYPSAESEICACVKEKKKTVLKFM